MTRRELAAAIQGLPDEEKLELLSELWDSLDQDAVAPAWHHEELGRRLDSADVGAGTSWSEVKARILGSR